MKRGKEDISGLHISSYIPEVLCGGKVDRCDLPDCPECGAVACLEHVGSWYYSSADPRDEDLQLALSAAG